MEKALRGGGLALITALVLTTLEAQNPRPSVEDPAALVRERQLVAIGNVTETWELRWKTPPKPACEPIDSSLTCPCTGFAYGEGGDLILVRIRDGEEIDRLELTQLFKGADVNLGEIAVLQRWEPNYETDFEASQKNDFLDVVARRSIVKIMEFIDYDHDGQRSEFFLQTDTLPCGKRLGVVVGVSNSNQKLHVFGTATKPTEGLLLEKGAWEALSRAQGPIEIVEWPCGDHGSDEETTVRLEYTDKGIDGVRHTFACPRYPGQHPIRDEPL
ncbi:MAG: hypothetical protein ABSH32_03355 [Bryobacteraceae bacterium]|jgi:hypothetical protein